MATKADTRSRFKTRWSDRRIRYWLRKDPPRRPGFRAAPEVVRFDPVDGGGEAKPAVRIFLGTEPMQARAERVFLWSVAKRRDPSRAYEVHLMRDLVGFDRDRWTTGFTNYRFAIPALAGGEGRAIYNDVDQIYLADPGEMFDLDMGPAGVLCVDEGETSVALIDCAAMSAHWRIEDARTKRLRRHFLDPLVSERLWGPLPPEWNARDDEYRPGRSKCFHFTTLRLQPWRPFPDQLRYREHPDAGVWRALEAEANAVRFNAFSRARPSSCFAASLERLAEPRSHEEGAAVAAVADFASAHERSALLDCSVHARRSEPSADPRSGFPFSAPGERRPIVLSAGALGALPEDDVPWALDELFAASDAFVFVAVSTAPDAAAWTAGALPAEWWRLQMELASARTPGRGWRLALFSGRGRRPLVHEGGNGAAFYRAA